MAVVAKARAAQLTSFRSITAAAEGLVTFQFCSSWQKARLLACLGSSAAQWNGGYENCCVFAGPNVLIGSIPGGPVCRPYGMVWGGASGRPRPTWDGISGTGGADSRPCGEFGSGPFFFVGAGHWPARRRASAIPEPNLIRLAYARHLPLKGKAVGRVVDPPLQRITERMRSFRRGRSQTGPRAATWGRPYSSQKFFRVWVGEALGPPAVNGPGTVCSANPGAGMEPRNLKFLLTQGPVAREERRKVTQILRAGTIAGPNRYASPVMGDRG